MYSSSIFLNGESNAYPISLTSLKSWFAIASASAFLTKSMFMHINTQVLGTVKNYVPVYCPGKRIILQLFYYRLHFKIIETLIRTYKSACKNKTSQRIYRNQCLLQSSSFFISFKPVSQYIGNKLLILSIVTQDAWRSPWMLFRIFLIKPFSYIHKVRNRYFTGFLPLLM